MIIAIISQVFLFLYNIATAEINSNMEKKDLANHKTGSIKHGWWALAFLLIVAGFMFLDYERTYGYWYQRVPWYLFFALLFERKLVLDISYNLFQERNIFYVSPNPASIDDRIYYWIFNKNVKLYQIINFILSLGLQYFIFK